MYIENNRATMSGEEKVNDATAALKGMLGIGSSPAIVMESSTDSTAPVKEEQPTKSKKKKKKKKQKDGAPQKTLAGKGQQASKKNNKQDTSEKFVWSAFQASPDASTLPIPAFSPPPKSKRALNPDAAAELTNATSNDPPPVKVTHTAVPAENAKPKPNELETKKEDGKSENTTESPPVEEVTSNTGINLAALASPPSHQTTTVHQAPPQPVPPNYSPVNAPLQYQQQPPPPIYNASPPQQHPQFVMIQVQVPPVLLPGRQMVVASPMGYPVQVRVPEGVPPGMVIPVHVPVAPPPQQQAYQNNSYPYGHPLHRR
jgi:hypothetical protein